jgi:hypothetical protein
VLETQQEEGNFIYSLNLKKEENKVGGFFPPFSFSIAPSLLVDKCAIHCASFEWKRLLAERKKEEKSDENWMKRGTRKRSEIKRFARTNQVVERAKKEKEKKVAERHNNNGSLGPRRLAHFFLKYFHFFFFFIIYIREKEKKKVESVFVFAVRPRVNGLVTWRNGRKRREKAENPPTPSSSPYKCEIERKWRNERERERE